MTRRQSKLARRAARTGSGPVPVEAAPPRWPGAANTFALLAYVLFTGGLVVIASLPVITFPLAMAAGTRYLRRFLKGEVSRAGRFGRDLLAGLPGGLVVGVAVAGASGLLLLNTRLAASGALPGGAVIGPVSWAAFAVVVLVAVTMAANWTPETGWRPTLRTAANALSADPAGALFVLASVVLTGVVTAQVAALIIPALGCVALAVVAAPERRRTDAAD